MKNIVLSIFCLLTVALTGCNATKLYSAKTETSGASISSSQPATRLEKSFQASEKDSENPNGETSKFTGTYELKSGSRANEFKVLELQDNELKVSFLGNAEFESQVGPMANSGEIQPTIIRIKGDKAVLTPEDSPDCRITLLFKGTLLEVSQNENDCGFPGGVLAEGTYRKTDSTAPIFDESEETAPKAILENQFGNVQDDTAKRVRFVSGENSATITGKIRNGVSITYLVGAQAGQTMNIKVTDGGENNDVVFDVFSPDGTRLGGDRLYDDWRNNLPKTGDYVVTVSTFESQNVSYKLQITIH